MKAGPWLLGLAVLLAGSGLRAADYPPGKEDRTRAAFEAVRAALRALPPGEDADRIKQALGRIGKQLVAGAESDVGRWQERVTWGERMARKGYLTDNQVKADRARLRAAEAALERLRKEVNDLGP